MSNIWKDFWLYLWNTFLYLSCFVSSSWYFPTIWRCFVIIMWLKWKGLHGDYLVAGHIEGCRSSGWHRTAVAELPKDWWLFVPSPLSDRLVHQQPGQGSDRDDLYAIECWLRLLTVVYLPVCSTGMPARIGPSVRRSESYFFSSPHTEHQMVSVVTPDWLIRRHSSSNQIHTLWTLLPTAKSDLTNPKPG